jgi:glyoxylase-like metal-dependent hydrolase (beta-lactamase superfamily II)/rhodanese-related sulfurtransferase
MALKSTCLLDTLGAFEAPESLRDGIIQFRVGSTNSWILANRNARTCIIIDPCETVAERMEHYIRCQKLDLLAVLDTHSHGDHESIRPILQKVLADRIVTFAGRKCDSLGWPIFRPDQDFLVTLDNGMQASALHLASASDGDLVLARMATPGHTDDSSALLFGLSQSGTLKKENIYFAFSGDTILSGGLGRTNFSVSDPVALFHSLRKLHLVLSPSTLLCPSHDYNHSFATSLKTEATENSMLGLALSPMTPMTLDLFLKRKAEIDTELAKLEENFQGIVCGVTQAALAVEYANISIRPQDMNSYLHQKTTSPLLIDVRESQEFLLFKDWDLLGLKVTPRNVPLSRFVNLMDELIRSKQMNQEILLICRTGSRSFQAAKSLRRLGFSHAWNLEGGVALLDAN